MLTPKEIVDFLKESMQDNNWYVDTKKIGTPPNHRFFSPTLVRNHVAEAHKQLSAKQKKIAAIAGDKDKIDADDLAKLRSSKNEDVGMYKGPAEVTATKNSDAVAQSIVTSRKVGDKAGNIITATEKSVREEATNEVAPPGWEGTVKGMKKHKNIDNPWALAWSMKKKGYKSHVKENNDSHTHAAHFTNEKGEWSGMALIDAKDDDDAVDQAHKISAGNKWKNFKLASVERHVPVKEDIDQIDEVNARHSFVAAQQALTPKSSDVKSAASSTARDKAKTNKYARRISKITSGEYSKQDVKDNLKGLSNEEAELDEASGRSIVDNLKSRGKYEDAGAAAHKHGLGRKYGPHFGMRDTYDRSEAAFHRGYDKAELKRKYKIGGEDEHLAEISTNTASSYADKAWASGDDKRAKGLNLAIKKMSGKAKVSTNEEADQIEEKQMRPEITQIIEDATVRAWTQVHTKGSKAAREKLDKVHAKNPKYQAFKKGLDGHSAPAEKPKAAAPKEEPKSSEESPWQKLRRINAERTKRAMELGKAHRSGGVGSSGTSANQSPLEKKLGGHDVSHLERKKAPASLGASPSEREAEKADKKEAPKANAVERKPARLTGKKLGI